MLQPDSRNTLARHLATRRTIHSPDEDFQGLIDQVAPGISLQLYVESDKELPICFNAEVNEQQLLESLNTRGQDTIIVEGDSDDNGDSGDKENESFPTSSLKSYREVL